ncbi:TonB-dependent siderophore receptor [Xenorhabdus nematophila]|uniref:TonB-dependent siderophore receptor n=1 Tax=Xenorhabdus nematophila TaxID=628 RepID=UPI000541FBFD|nr:TonB-dependent siderophore receptor [Xenorhabdus nematophila]CEF31802.1 FhuE receptor (Outer-membrane receptor for ferric iron uptake) [Xenorhabdus nematophila str. Websteri]AYA39589.1 TonB-dependent siderophore receptor [Xenorhabdus nematophila]MBA0018154.1 TonB-dependent siderophore receptor [Xenorhabdus nematophila]MCB4424785.1 TonB-dependent siderophore receptor [Xenorhabdus nematophila]QNJ37238.1 TonB-dependent siderophore receptor [Xenorhabdus nematophila]
MINPILQTNHLTKRTVLSLMIPLILAGNSVAVAAEAQGKDDKIVVTAKPISSEHEGVTEDTGMYNTTSMVTSTGLNLSARETPQSVSVMTKQRMVDENLNSVESAIDRITGMTVHQADSDRFTFSSRGIGVRNMLRDGVPTFYDIRFNYGDNLLDTTIIDRLEVVRGAAGLMVGPGTPSAAVNVIRKRPTSDFRGEATLGGGSWDKWRTGIDLSGPLNENGTVRGRFVTAYERSNSFIDRDKHEKYPFYGIIEADLTENTLLTIGTDYQVNHTRGGMFGGLPIYFKDGSKTDYKRSNSYAPDWAFSKVRSFSTFTSLQHNFDNGWSVKGTFTYDSNTLDQKVLWATGFPDRATNEGMYPGNMTLIDGSRRQRNFDLQLNGNYGLLGRTHHASFGLNYQKQNFQNDYYYAPCMKKPFSCDKSPIGDFTQSSWGYSEPEWSKTRDNGSHGYIEQTAGYAVTQLSLADPVTLILGGRITSWKTRGDNFGTPQNADYKHEFVPYGGLVYNITPDFSVYGSYTKIFDPESRISRNNQLLKPVSGENYELGLKGVALDNGLDYSLALFEIRQNNFTIEDISGKPKAPGIPQNARVYNAINGVKTRGFEAEVSGQITDDWRIYAGYTQFRATMPGGKRINMEDPNRLFKLFTTYTLPGVMSDLTLGGGVNWQDKTSRMLTGPDRKQYQEGQGSFTTVNLMGRYQFTPDLSLTVNLNNLFDKKYYTSFGSYTQYYYGKPRNVEATLRYKF